MVDAGGHVAEFAQNCCNATLGPQTLLAIAGSRRSFKPPNPTHRLQPPFQERERETEREKGLCRLWKGTAQNVKPSYTGDKLLKPSPIEWTGLRFKDRKRAKATKNKFFSDLVILG
jgi:hypothetical protein